MTMSPSIDSASGSGRDHRRADSLNVSGRGVLDGAFKLLRALPGAGPEHQLGELARLTGIPRPSVYRLMAQLHAVGAVERVGGRYIVANSLAELARHADPLAGRGQYAGQVMRALRDRTGATVSLIVPRERGCSALEVVPGREPLPTRIYAGKEMPSLAAAALVFDPSAAPERADVINGWAVDHAHVHAGLTCYAAAIRVAGQVEAALQISSTVDRPSDRFAVLIRQCAVRIASHTA